MRKKITFLFVLFLLFCKDSNSDKLKELKEEGFLQALKSQNLLIEFVREHISKTVTIEISSNSKDDFHPIGSGFFINDEGYVLTCQHVVSGKKNIHVIIAESSAHYPAEIFHEDAKKDLALLKVDFGEKKPARVPHFQIPREAYPDTGTTYISFGAPHGLRDTVSSGFVSHPVRNKVADDRPNESYLQLSEPIVQGNSGGVVLDLSGRVIGMNRFTYSLLERGTFGPGFAIPSNVIYDFIRGQEKITSIKNKVQRGIVEIPFNTLYLAKKLDLPNLNGVIVSYPDDESPSKKSGILRYDYIVKVDGKTFNGYEEFYELMEKNKEKEKIKLTIIRNGKEIELEVGDK